MNPIQITAEDVRDTVALLVFAVLFILVVAFIESPT